MNNAAKIGLAILILIIFVGAISWWATHRNSPKNRTQKNPIIQKEVIIYQNPNDPFQFQYPPKFQVYREAVSDTGGWSYASVNKGELMVQLKLKSSSQQKTNLSEATFTVGRNKNPKPLKNCLSQPEGFMIQSDTVQKKSTKYVRSQYSDAGAGNYYNTVQYRTLRQNYCYSIEEMVHTTNIHNYPPERGISRFDSAKVWGALDSVWQSFHFTK
jgi:hypothetical protein